MTTRPKILAACALLTLSQRSEAAERKQPLDLTSVTIQDRADAASIKVYEAGATAPGRTTAIAEVYGLSCEGWNGQTEASSDDATNQIRIKAAQLKATAVVSLAYTSGWQPNPLLRRRDIKCSSFVLATGIAVTMASDEAGASSKHVDQSAH